MKICAENLFKTLCATLFAAIFAFTLSAFYQNAKTVKADAPAYSVFLPHKSEEYHALSSPIHAYSDDDITAITESTVLTVLKGDEVITKSGRSSLNQVKRVNNDLYFNDFSRIYKLPISDLAAEPQFISLTGTYFDINENFIVVIYNEVIELYKTDDLTAPYRTVSSVQNKPVAVNGTSMFYIAGDRICREYFSDSDTTIKYNEVQPDYMIADDDYLFYVKDNDIFRVSLTDKTTVKLNYEENGNYDLGNIRAPKGLAFKNGNLLITDSENGSVQEYRITGDKLEFTGYAVASGLSAYNRVAASATDIERYGKFVAALDDYKLTVIDTENSEDYDKAGFINKFVNAAPERFALGNGTIMYSQENDVHLADIIGDKDIPVQTGFNTTALDISYQSGVYYIAYTDGSKTTVVKIDETTGEKTDNTEFDAVAATIVAADVFKNVYVADGGNIYKNTSATSYAFSGAKKLATDLAGNLFVLSSDGKIHKLNETENSYEFTVAFETPLGKIKSFGFSFDEKETFFLVENKEEVFSTENAGNVSLKDVNLTAEFNAATTRKTELKVYTADDKANVYSVSKNENAFKFNGLTETAAEYPLIATLNVNDSLTLFALASEKGVVLINEKELTAKATVYITAPEKAFITTAVSAYAIPVIENNETFALTDAETKIRLNKGTEITVSNAFTLLNREFYEATATIDGTEREFYIPANFTVETLSEDLKFDVYEIETVKTAVLYKNEDLTEELFVLNGGEKVKVLERHNGILKISAKNTDGEEVIGYISEKDIKTNPNTTVRNVLIIIAVFGSLAGTVSYFLLRKKR